MDLLARQAPTLFGVGREPQRAPATVTTPATRADGVPRPPRLPMRPTAKIRGELVQLVPIGDLARAVGRSVGHVRLLEQRGVLPPPQARRRVAGHRGWRLYRADFVAAVALIAAEERVASRRAVMDLSTFQARVWAVHAEMQATARPTSP
jgi:hypothetical protein